MADRGLTRVDLMIKSGVSINTITMILATPNKVVYLSTAKKVAKALKVGLNDIFLVDITN